MKSDLTAFKNLQIKAIPPVCDLLNVLRKEEELCVEALAREGKNRTSENNQFMNSGKKWGFMGKASCSQVCTVDGRSPTSSSLLLRCMCGSKIVIKNHCVTLRTKFCPCYGYRQVRQSPMHLPNTGPNHWMKSFTIFTVF